MTLAEINRAVRSLAYLKTPDKVRAGLRNTYGVNIPLYRVERALGVIHAEGVSRAKPQEQKDSDGWLYDVRTNRNVPAQAELTRPTQMVAPNRPAFRQREPLPKCVPPPSPNPFVGPFQFKVLAKSVGQDFGISVSDICGKARFRKLILPRVTLTKLCIEQGMSCAQIGRKMGGRDHSTIMNQRNIFDAYAAIYPTMRDSYERHVALREEARALREASA